MRKLSLPYRNKQIFMIPNRYGFIAVGFFILFALVAATYSNNLLFLLAFLHVSFLLIAILQTARNLRHIEVVSIDIDSGFPGERAAVRVLISQRSRLSKIGLTLECRNDKVMISEITQGDQKLVTLFITLPETRGEHSIDRLRLSTDAPYGLFYGWLYFKQKVSFYVYPRPLGEELNPSNFAPGAGDFSGLREFQEGDSPQRISWKHSGKSEKWLIKEFNESINPQCLLRLADCPQTESEAKLSQLALWVVTCEEKRLSYQLELSAKTPYGVFAQGREQYHQCLKQLATWSHS